MNRIVYHIDEKGFIIDSYVGEFNENGEIITEFPLMNIVIETLPQPLPFHKPRWNGTEWVEGESEEVKVDREALQALIALQPTAEELEDAKFEIKILTLLSELGMI